MSGFTVQARMVSGQLGRVVFVWVSELVLMQDAEADKESFHPKFALRTFLSGLYAVRARGLRAATVHCGRRS